MLFRAIRDETGHHRKASFCRNCPPRAAIALPVQASDPTNWERSFGFQLLDEEAPMKRGQRLFVCLIALGAAVFAFSNPTSLAAVGDCPLYGSCASQCGTGGCDAYGPDCIEGCDAGACSGSQKYVFCQWKE